MHHNNYPWAVLLARIILIHLKCLSTLTHGTRVIIHLSLFPFVLLCNTKKTFSCKWCKVLKQALNNNTVDPTKRLFGTRLGKNAVMPPTLITLQEMFSVNTTTPELTH